MGYDGTTQLLSLTEFYIPFILALFCWLNHKPMKEWRKPDYLQKTPDELQKMLHTKGRKFKDKPRLETAL